MVTDSQGEDDDGAGDARKASLLVEIHSHVRAVYITEPDKNNVLYCYNKLSCDYGGMGG